ncbi:MAG: N-acetylmuramoyl-L-alanine amidase, partial [Ignavibacteriaceae bacterium]|nr:N-acetylmuramoyl-L-alanine amidase [Ignavibacteriaceae bacterium]
TIHNKVFTKSETKNQFKDKWGMDVIVIDAGHGGKDAGAIGVNGTKEKDANLGIALKLGELIKQNLKDVKVVYTRSGDYFVELYKRGKIANEKNGKLFISIHCNSTKKKPSDASGFEVYLLRPGRTQEAIAIAETENSVIDYEDNPNRYQQLTDENFILVSMAHSSYMKYSEKFSEQLNNQFTKKLSLSSRGVKQAGFYVLVGASMPSVLIESGFLSNHSDAKYLTSKKGQQEIAESIFNAVKDYKLHYEKMIEAEM